MSEYKLLKDFDEIVPGMIFETIENEDDNYLNIVNVQNGRIEYKFNRMPFASTMGIGSFTCQYKLIHDPRKKKEMTIQEKINEHKKQIEILEKELEKESLKNVFVKHQYYKIKTKADTFICKFDMSDCDNKFICVECVDRFTRNFSTDDIQKVWHIENLKDVFGFSTPIFERKD